MSIPRTVAFAVISCAAGCLIAAEPPATLPAKPVAVAPVTSPSTRPSTAPSEPGWIDAAAFPQGRKWAVVMVLKEGAGPQEIKDEFRLSMNKDKIGIWSPYFAELGFQPGKITSAGGFPGGYACTAKSESEKVGSLTWSVGTFSSPGGVEHAEVTVLWEKPDGTKSLYKGPATPRQWGPKPEELAASKLLAVFGDESGVQLRAPQDETEGISGSFMTYEYRVGEGEKQKRGVVRLLHKSDYWRLAYEQPSPDMLPADRRPLSAPAP